MQQQIRMAATVPPAIAALLEPFEVLPALF
jgi:hypothetical protein